MATDKQQDFIQRLAPYAQEVQRKYGVPASIVMAQAALESGWGDNVKGNNFFGVKAGKSWDGRTVAMATHEYVQGNRVGITDTFRAYRNLGDSVDNYARVLATDARYAKVMQATTAHQAAEALQRAGYATDPKYAEKLKSVIASNSLERFDDPNYKGYLQDDRFAATRRRLQEQREEQPQVWSNFMTDFFQALAGLVAQVVAAISGGTDQAVVSPPSPTPARQPAPRGAVHA